MDDDTERDSNQTPTNLRGSRQTRTRSRSEASSTADWNVGSILPSEISAHSTSTAVHPTSDAERALAFQRRLSRQFRLANQRRAQAEHYRGARNNNTDPSAATGTAASRGDGARPAAQRIDLQAAIDESMHAFRTTGLNVTTIVDGRETTEFVRLPPADDNGNANDPNTTLGRRVLASAAAGRAAAQRTIAQQQAELTTLLRRRRMSFDRQNERPDVGGNRGNNELAQGDLVNSLPFIRHRARRRINEEPFPVTASDDDTSATDTIPAVRPIASGRSTATFPPPRRRNAAEIQIDNPPEGQGYRRVVDPQSSSTSYNVTRLLNADGDEYVHQISAQRWMNTRFPDTDDDDWENVIRQRQMANWFRPDNDTGQTPVATSNVQRVPLIPVPRRASPSPPPRRANRRRRNAEIVAQTPIEQATLDSHAEALRREVEEMDSQFQRTMRTLTRLGQMAPGTSEGNRFFEVPDGRNVAELPVGGTSSADTLPRGLREQLADETPYYIYPLPQRLDQILNNNEQRIAVPATTSPIFAAR